MIRSVIRLIVAKGMLGLSRWLLKVGGGIVDNELARAVRAKATAQGSWLLDHSECGQADERSDLFPTRSAAWRGQALRREPASPSRGNGQHLLAKRDAITCSPPAFPEDAGERGFAPGAGIHRRRAG